MALGTISPGVRRGRFLHAGCSFATQGRPGRVAGDVWAEVVCDVFLADVELLCLTRVSVTDEHSCSKRELYSRVAEQFQQVIRCLFQTTQGLFWFKVHFSLNSSQTSRLTSPFQITDCDLVAAG